MIQNKLTTVRKSQKIMSNSKSNGPQSMTSDESGSDLELSSDDDADNGVVQNQVGAYQGKPLGNYEDEEDTGFANHVVDDPD